jgi:penicillin-binding protein 2
MQIYLLERIFRICLSVLVIAVWYHQIIKGPYFNYLSYKNHIRVLPIIADRGDILDTEGKKLATEKASFNLVAIPQELTKGETVFKELSWLLGVPKDELLSRYHNNFSTPFTPVVLSKDVSLEKIFIIEEKKPRLEGIDIQVIPKRIYPFGPTAAHLIGYLGEINSRELEKLKPYGYRIRNLVGKMGLEKSFDMYLKGKAGGTQIEVDNRSNLIRILGEKKMTPGKDIELTINIRWQKIANRLLQDYKGTILIMDVRDGRILVMENSPAFNPNFFISGYGKDLKQILHSRKSPLLNRALKANFPPGSIFKLVTAIAGLERNKINISSKYNCEGKVSLGKEEFRCWEEKGHGSQTLTEAIIPSCNIFFYKLGAELGPENLRNFAKLMDLGENSGVEIREENKGLIPSPAWKYATHREKWFAGDTFNFAIGQGFVLVSPIQILRMVAAIANGGFLVKPYLVKHIGKTPTQEIKRDFLGIKKEYLKILQEAMFQVVNHPYGTGNRAKVEGLGIAAKTATAQTRKEATHAWISGFLPYSNPKLAFVVFLEEGGRGGVEAADICHKLFSEIKEEVLRYQ